MANKKKVTTVTTEEEITPAEEHDKAVLEALDTPDEALTIEVDKLDEKEETTEKVETEDKKEEPAPPIDTEAIKAELKEEVTKAAKEEIVSQLQGSKEEKKDAYAEFEKEIWDKEGRTPTYKEALDLIKIQAKEEIKAELNAEIEEENKQKEDAVKAQETQQQQLNDTLNKDWDEQISDLTRSGKLPAIVDPNNNEVTIVKDASGKEIERVPVDPGKRARYDLFKAMYLVSEERTANGFKPITNLKEIFYEHYEKKQPAGANAPIAGVRKSVGQESATSFKYSDVHNRSLEDLLTET